jgi:hypothetical protein
MMNVYKVTLTTGKVILMREPKIEDTEKVAQIAGKKAGTENNAHLSILIQKEMLKLLLQNVNGKDLTLSEKEQLDKLLDFKEYQQALKVMGQLIGDDSGNEPQIEFATTGEL